MLLKAAGFRGGLAALCCAGSLLGQEIHLKTRVFRTEPARIEPARIESTLRARALAGTGASDNRKEHRIVEFDHAPGVEDLSAIAAAGGEVTGALPDNAVIVTGLASGNSFDVPGVRWSAPLAVSDKLSPELERSARQLSVIVEFHGDVDTAAQDRVAAGESLALLRPSVLLAGHALLRASWDEIQSIAGHDEVAYVFPADAGVEGGAELHACAGMLTLTGKVGQYANLVHGWDMGSDKAAHLSYVFGTLTTKVESAIVQAEVVRALNEWAKNSNVIFQQGQSATAAHTVNVRFVSGSHGDSYPFDGPGGTLAHTFYPVPVNPESIAGDMHLDADENWHAGGDPDVYSVALHEAGHALGLGHSDKPGDVMYPYYRRNPALSVNDVGALRSLYGEPGGMGGAGAPTAPTAPAPSPSQPAPATALTLTPDPAAASTSSAQATLTGVVSGGTGAVVVQWQTDHGYSGRAALAGRAWTAAGIVLANGSNAISLTAFDAVNHSVSKTVLVTRSAQTATGSGVAPVSIRIGAPAGAVVSTTASTLTVTGTAVSARGIKRVAWQTVSASGEAKGAEQWVSGAIPLLVGTNTVVVRAWDNAGGSAWAAFVVIRQ